MKPAALVLTVLALTSASLAAQAPPSPAATAPAVVPSSSPSAAATVAPGRVWVGREREFEEFLETAPVARFEDVPVGVTKPRRGFFEPGGLAESMVFKPLPPRHAKGFYESYKSEIAAYRLDRLLGLGMVPPTVQKRVRHEVGSAQLWVERCSLLKTRSGQQPPDTRAWNRQVYRQRVWDNLVANIDRNQGNLLVDDDWNLVLIDHSRCFTGISKLRFPMIRIDRPFYERLKALTKDDLETHLKGLLIDGTKSILKRRDAIIAHFDKLIAERGEAAVLTE